MGLRVTGAAQREAKRNVAPQNRDRCDLRRSRFCAAPLRTFALVLRRVRDTN